MTRSDCLPVQWQDEHRREDYEMRLPGYCTVCRKITSVKVNGMPTTGTPTGTCMTCARKSQRSSSTGVSQRSFSGPAPEAEGTRVRLLRMGEDPCPMTPGAVGTVTGGNSSQLWVDWDNGRGLILSLPEDNYEVIG